MELPITGHTKLTALLGKPVAHSLSPLMHNEAFHLLGLDYVYLCFEVDETSLPDVVKGLRFAGIRGFNLTMPNKNRTPAYIRGTITFSSSVSLGRRLYCWKIKPSILFRISAS